jgi:hypothetical protein
MLARPTGLFLAPFLLGLGHFRASLVNTIVTTALFGAAYVAGAHWGILGVCVGAAVAYPLQFLFWVMRISVVRPGCFGMLLRPLLRPGLAGALMYGVVLAVSWSLPAGFSPLARLFLLVGIGLAAYPTFAYLICRDIVKEVVSLLGLDRLRRRVPRPVGIAGS